MPSFTVRNLAVTALLLSSAAPAFADDAQPALGLARLNHLGSQISSLSKNVADFLGLSGNQAKPQPLPERPKTVLTARAIEPTEISMTDTKAPGLPAVPELPAALNPPAPSTETPLRRLFCVEYARIRSGFNIAGDAKQWWHHAASSIYAHLSHPVEEAVMVFSGSKRLRKGHVAVVTHVIGPRQIIVDQANWQNRGEIDHATPVLDVSKKNDWSQVRVWDVPSGTFGARTYAISGFISKQLTRQASAN